MSSNAPAAGDRRIRVTVRAAGGLVLRPGADGDIRIAVVHRPLYDDWSFPKGKVRPAETTITAALREVREETGFLCVAELQLGTTEYIDRRGRSKRVTYWAMNRITGTFAPNDEVDALQWLRPAETLLRLSHEHDRDLLICSTAVLRATVGRRDALDARSSG